jgi:hypothetical protein
MTDLEILESSEMFKYTWINKRQTARYANVFIASCKSTDWWYKNLVGMEFFCLLKFKDYGDGEFLYEAIPVRLTNTTIQEGRGFDASDIIIK